MTDSTDDQERGMPSEIDEATEAFEALRRTVEKLARDLGGEMVVIRKGVEAAFERFETFQQPADHSVDIGQMVESLVLIAQHLTAIQKSPALKNGPEHYARVIETAAERISANAVRTLENRERGLQRVEGEIREIISGVRDRRTQERWLLGALAVGIVMGGVFLALGPRLLPGSIDKAVASTVMNADRWDAGIALMQSASPEGWRGIANARLSCVPISRRLRPALRRLPRPKANSGARSRLPCLLPVRNQHRSAEVAREICTAGISGISA